MIDFSNKKYNINSLNQHVNSNTIEFIKSCELNYFSQITSATNTIINNMDNSKIVLLSGPSGSTKTTTSEKITEQLQKNNISSVVISLDNFFINRDILPKLPNGDTDFESVKTLDIPTLQRCLHELLVDKESVLPIFDFPSGTRSSETQNVSIKGDTILIIEGIHAINPELTTNENDDKFLKVYVSPNTDYCNDNDDIILSSRDTRLIRRLVRDYFYRGSALNRTFDMWGNVVASENENILPYRKNADIFIDTSIHYEPCIYSAYIDEISSKCTEIDSKFKPDFDRIVNILNEFAHLSREFIPIDTVLHEFIQ